MQNPVSPTKPGGLASPQERARTVQAVLDKDGPEMDRRRELTQEVVDALACQDLLRMLLPKSMGGQEVNLVDYAKACEALAWSDAEAQIGDAVFALARGRGGDRVTAGFVSGVGRSFP